MAAVPAGEGMLKDGQFHSLDCAPKEGTKRMIQRIKDYLVALGPKNPIVRVAVRLHARRNGFAITFSDNSIAIERKNRRIVVGNKDLYLVPITMECFDQCFGDVIPKREGSIEVLNFSGPGSYQYKRHEVSLSFPGAPEEDSIAAYTHWHVPQPGELVFDAGAHAGFTTCMFAKMVGAQGKVVAFEPDATTFEYLKKNVLSQGLTNVTLVPKALDANTGTAYFNADGTMGAGLVEHSVYGNTGQHIAVETLSLQDACQQYGVPNFLKMDIEGAEISVLEAGKDFLRAHPMHLAFDSYHRMRDGRFTWTLLEPMLRALNYRVESSAEFGQVFTWAMPNGAS